MKLATKRRNGSRELGFSEDFSKFQSEVANVFNRAWRSLLFEPWTEAKDLIPWPAVDVSETDNALVLKVDVPDVDPKDIDIEVSGNLLTIRGSREEEHEEGNGLRYYERRTGRFERTLTLPSYADASKIEAKYDKGTLTISIQKVPGQGAKKVPIKTS